MPAKPKSLISFVYHITYDPEVNEEFLKDSRTQLQLIDSFGITGNLKLMIHNAGTGAGPTADPGLPAIENEILNAVKDKFRANQAPQEEQLAVVGAKPKGLISFIYNVIHDPNFRNDFLGDQHRKMQFAGLNSSALRDQLMNLWQFADGSDELKRLPLDLVWDRLKMEIEGNYLLVW